MKRITALLLSLFFAVALTGCAGGKTEEKILHMGVMYSSDIIPLAVIKEQGLDSKAGFTLDIQVFSSARDRDAALQAGELDGVFTDFIGVCVYQNAGLDVKITGVTDGDYLLLAAPGSGIQTLADAAGKKVAISQNTLIEYALDYLIKKDGYPPDYLAKELVPRIPDRLELLRSGAVSICLLPEPFASLAKKDGAQVLGSANAAGLYPAVSAFMQSSIDAKRDAVKRFYTAYDQAVNYINETPIASLEQVAIDGAGFPEELAGSIELPQFRQSTLPETADLEKAIAWAAEKGLCEKDLAPSALLANIE